MTWASTARLLSRLALAGLTAAFCVLMAVLVPVEVWAAAPTPSPYPTTGQAVPNSWHCDQASADPVTGVSSQDCAVTGWQTIPPESVAASDPLPVHEVSPPPPQPAPTVSASLSLCSSSASPSTSPTDSASPSPSPTSSDSPSPSPSCDPLPVQLSGAQWEPFIWMGGTLVLLTTAGFIVTHARRTSRL